MNTRIFNFSAGPATLPLPVLEKAQKEIVNFRGTGIGIMEISHRSKEFVALYEETVENFRQILGIPDNYRILFLQGGASSQFFMVPMNLLRQQQKATYLNTGTWSKKAIDQAKLFGEIHIGFSSEESTFDRVPGPGEFSVAEGSEYLYYTSNNTIFGTQFQQAPEAAIPLVCDMSSDILSKPINIEKHGIIFAGAQKNLGPAGVTLVIIREDLLDQVAEHVPTMLKYKTHADKDSMFNTPPTFPIYVVGEVLKWVKQQGGLVAIQQANREKAALLYQQIDRGEYYRGHATISSRSDMNVSFNLATAELEAQFIKEALARGLSGLKGHRSIGGCRASIYNAFPRKGVEKLVQFMDDFQRQNPL